MFKIKKYFWAVIWSMGLISVSQISWASQDLDISLKVEKFTLENGMTVILHVDKRIPMVSVNQWYDVGSFQEDKDRTGLAHFFEHLMFKGTKTNPDGEFDKIVSQVGGQNNAFTSNDYTGYYEIIPKSALEDVLKLEADRMTNLVLSLPLIQKEREVVKEERRMRTENSPDGFIYEAMFKEVFNDYPYASPVIGSMEHLNKATLNDFKEFYKKYYSPNNSVLVLVGDFDLRRAKKLIRKYYSKISKSELPKLKTVEFVRNQKPKFIRESKRFNNRKLAIYFDAPGSDNKASYALDILCEAVAGDSASPLYKILVEQRKIANSVSFWNQTLKYAGILAFNADIVAKNSFTNVEKIFYQEINNVRSKGLSENQLQKAKDKISLAYVKSLRTLNGKARMLAQSEILKKDYSSFFNDLKQYEAVTNEDIIRVAKEYLNKKNSSTIHLGQ